MAERKARSEVNPLNFEKSLKQLEAIVKRLEDEELPLDQALKLFAEGQTLARGCEAQLRAAENQVRQLLETPEGEIAETAFETTTSAAEPDDGDDEADEDEAAPPPRKPPAPRAHDDLPF